MPFLGDSLRVLAVRLFVCLSVCPSVPCPPLTQEWKTIQRFHFDKKLPTAEVTSRAIVKSRAQSSKVRGQRSRTEDGHVKIVFGAYLRAKQITGSHKAKTRITSQIILYSAAVKIRTFHDNRATGFDCANVLFQLDGTFNGTSAQCCELP